MPMVLCVGCGVRMGMRRESFVDLLSESEEGGKAERDDALGFGPSWWELQRPGPPPHMLMLLVCVVNVPEGVG